MNKRGLLILFIPVLFTTSLLAQLKLKLQKLQEPDTWGVFVKPSDSISPSDGTITGSGQVTIVGHLGTTFTNLTNHSGTWVHNAIAIDPVEAPGSVYFSAGFISDMPPVLYKTGVETLLFTFQASGEHSESISLIENGKDPFDHLPNSLSSNPGNELSVVDFNVSPAGYYFYEGNYFPENKTNGLGETSGKDDTPASQGDNSGGNPIRLQPRWFNLSPNPALEWVQVDFGNKPFKDGSVVKLLNAGGMLIGKMDKGEQNLIDMNIKGLPAGIYYIMLEQKGQILQQERFIKQ